MKTLLLTLGLAFLFGLGALWLRATPQPQTSSTPPRAIDKSVPALSAAVSPTVGSPSATPSTIVINTPTTVTVTVAITPAPILNGVNLLRIRSTGAQPTILGVMHDDGKNGDAVAADGVYTLRIPFNEPTAGPMQLQVSAAFQGLLKRVTSNLFTIAVWTDVAPTNSPVSFSFDIPPQWTIAQQPGVVNILPPNKSVDQSQEYAGDYIVFIDANPNNLSPQNYYNGNIGPDLYGDASSITNFTVSGHAAVQYAQTTGIDGVDTVVIVLPNYFLRIEDRGDSTTFDQIVQTFTIP